MEITHPLLFEELQKLYPRQKSTNFIECYLRVYGRNVPIEMGKLEMQEIVLLNADQNRQEPRLYLGTELAHYIAVRYNTYYLIGVFIELYHRAQGVIGRDLVRACLGNTIYQTVTFALDATPKKCITMDTVRLTDPDKLLSAAFDPWNILECMGCRAAQRYLKYEQKVRKSMKARLLKYREPAQLIAACREVDLPRLASYLQFCMENKTVRSFPEITVLVGKILKRHRNSAYRAFRKEFLAVAP